MAKLWDKEITVDEQISLLEDFSSYLEVSMLVTIEKFKSIIILQKSGWLNVARDFLTDTLPEVCDEVGQYLVKSKLMNPPNWKIFLKDRLEIAKEAGQAIYSYHEKCFQICASQYQQQYQATYEQELAKQDGLGFGIISSSLAAHLVYAAQSASKERQNEKKASDAADRIMQSSLDPVEKAAQMTIAFYHEKFDPFVNDFLIGFYSDIERLIYDGLDVDKETLDNNKMLSGNELLNITEDNHRERITASLSKYPFNGDALFWAVRYDDAKDELIEFCSNNPLLIPKYLVAIEQSVVAYLKKQKEKSDLYNRDPLTDEVILLLLRIRTFMTDERMCGTSIYDSIVQEVYGERIDTVCQKFDTLVKIKKTPLALSNYAKNNKSIYVDNNDFETLVKYNAIFGTSKLKDIFDVIPNAPEDFNKMLLELRQAIQSENEKHQEAERQRKQRERELAEKKRKEEEQRKEAERQEELKRQAEKEKQKQLFIQKAKKVTVIIAIIAFVISIVAFIIYWCSPASKFEYVEKDTSHITITKVNQRAIKDGTLTIPDKIFGKIVTGIQPNALANSEISTIIIPASMTEFDIHTFAKCTNLTSIDFEGNVAEWIAITNINDFDKYHLTHTGVCDFSEWFFEEGFDCTQGGAQFRTCKMCKTEESRVVNADEHTVKTLNSVSPTCTETGVSEGKQCAICNKVILEQIEIPATGHTEVIDIAVAPTCTQTGLTEGKHCSVCKKTIIAQRTVNKESHSLEGWQTIKPPTCTKTGTERNNCANCSYYTERVAVSTGHSFTSNHCSNCGIEKPSQGLIYNVVSDGYEVADIGSCTDTRIVLPDYYNGKPVVSIGNSAFASIDTISEIVMQEGLLRIGNSAFSYSSITTAKIPDSVTFIGEDAFDNCDSLISVYLGTGLTSTGGTIFAWCDDLTSIYCPSVEVWCRASLRIFYCYGAQVYFNNVLAEEITIPGTIEKIGYEVFSDIRTLTTVRIAEGVKEISFGAFYDTTKSLTYYKSFTTLYLPSTITYIGSDAFPYTLETVYYNGTMAEWQAVTNYEYFTKVICTDGVVKK